MSADKQLKAYIDRVLRLKEEQDTLGDDIREVYAEAKSEGYDKTIMGKLVAHLRKVAKSGEDAVSEQEMNFDTYLQAYHRASGTAVATHTHEKNFERFDPLTGEFLDDNVDPKLAHTIVTGLQTEAGRAALIAAVDIMIEQEEAEEETHQRPSTNDEPYPEAGPQAEASPAGTGTGTLADREGRHDASDQPLTGGEDVESSAKRAGLEGGPVNLEPSGPVADMGTKSPSPLRPFCQKPEMCGGVGRNHCYSCTKMMEAAE